MTMGVIDTVDKLATCVSSRSQRRPWWRAHVSTTTAAGQYVSFWAGSGSPGQGAVPTTTAVPTSATAGALMPFTNPGASEFAYLYAVDAVCLGQASTVLIYDRLVHVGGLDGTVTTLNTINTSTLTRGKNAAELAGEGVVGFIECYTTLGSTTRNATVIYTNSDGTGSRSTTVVIPANYRAGRLLPIPLLTGDWGIQSVQSVQLSGTTGTAGNYGVTLARLVTELDTKRLSDARRLVGLSAGLNRIEPDACLWLVTIPQNTTASTICGSFTILTSGAALTNESTTLDAIMTLAADRAQVFDVARDQANTTIAIDQFFSMWQTPGAPTGTGVAPGTGAVPTSATAGALVNFVDPGASNFAHLYSLELNNVCPGPTYIYDRLYHVSGLSGTSTSLQTLGAAAISRGDTTGADVQGFIECYSQLGGSGTTATVIYTNSAGTGSRSTTVTIPANMRVNRLLQIPLADGDIGIKSVESVQLAGSTGSVGDFGVTLGRFVAMLPTNGPALLQTEPEIQTGMELGYPQIDAGACLWMVSLASVASAATPPIVGAVTVVTTG